MSRKPLGCFIALLVSAGTAPAQFNYSLQTGSPTFSVASPVEMGFVNLANGNLHLEIPLGSFPERGGHTLTAKMVYDSRIWAVVNNGSESLWEPTNVPNSWSGWRFVTSADAGTVLPTTVMTNCGGSNYYDTYSAFTWTAPDGTPHVFPITTLQNVGCSGVTAVSSGNAMAEDSTGYNMYVTNYTQEPSMGQTAPSFTTTRKASTP